MSVGRIVGWLMGNLIVFIGPGRFLHFLIALIAGSLVAAAVNLLGFLILPPSPFPSLPYSSLRFPGAEAEIPVSLSDLPVHSVQGMRQVDDLRVDLVVLAADPGQDHKEVSDGKTITTPRAEEIVGRYESLETMLIGGSDSWSGTIKLKSSPGEREASLKPLDLRVQLPRDVSLYGARVYAHVTGKVSYPTFVGGAEFQRDSATFDKKVDFTFASLQDKETLERKNQEYEVARQAYDGDLERDTVVRIIFAVLGLAVGVGVLVLVFRSLRRRRAADPS